MTEVIPDAVRIGGRVPVAIEVVDEVDERPRRAVGRTADVPFDLAEAQRERELLIAGEVLVAEDEQVMLEERREDRVLQRVCERLRQIDAQDFRTGRVGERRDCVHGRHDSAPGPAGPAPGPGGPGAGPGS